MKVFLIGLPGCGKTTLGRKIAQLMDYDFVDLDEKLAQAEQMTITEIFSIKGEEQFRIIEKSHLVNWCNKDENYVMATGGGTPCFFSNIQLINQSGVSIFLDAAVDVIAQRMMRTELAKRPMFVGENVSTIGVRIEAMRNQRLPYYQQAQLTMIGDQIDANRITKAVWDLKG